MANKKTFRINLFLLLSLCLVNINLVSQFHPDSLIHIEVLGNDTDPLINFDLSKKNQIFYNGTSQLQNKLLIHLVGTYDNPNSTTLFPAIAANNGYHCINLMYRNWTAAQTACGSSTDLDCYLNFRREIIEGIDYSSEINVNNANSINNRLLKLLNYLNDNYPDQNWSQFYSENDILWNKITVSGHSQGGGHAAVIAMTNPIQRVLMFASPNDYIDTLNVIAPWTTQPHLVPDSNYYGFNALYDEVAESWQQYEQWDALGLDNFGDTVDVDQTIFPYNHSRQLYTKQIVSEPTTINLTHDIMIRDAETPIDGFGTPEFVCAWKYMLGIDCSLVSINEVDFNSVVKVYPNPTEEKLFIETSADSKQEYQFMLLDLSGREKMTFLMQGKEKSTLNIEFLAEGIYFLQIYHQNKIIGSQKVIKL